MNEKRMKEQPIKTTRRTADKKSGKNSRLQNSKNTRLGNVMVFSHNTVFFFPIPLSRYKRQDTAIFVVRVQ